MLVIFYLWQPDKNSEKALRYIIRFAQLLACLRGSVNTHETHGTQGINYSYDTPIIEDPSRAITQLINLARGHALSVGRNHIEIADTPLRY